MKVFHTADWHFDEKNHDEINKCLAFMVEMAITEKPDLFVVSGDITNSRYLDLDTNSARTILGLISKMLNIAPVAVVVGTPSHDGKTSLALRECRGKYPIVVSDYPEQYGYDGNMFVDIGSVPESDLETIKFVLTQVPQPTKQFFINDLAIEDTDKAIGQAMASMFSGFGDTRRMLPNVPHIVNGHGQIGGAYISETQQLIGRDIEVSLDQLRSICADLVCYGHIHKHQKMDHGVFYAGSPTRMNFGETEDKGFYIHDVSSTSLVSEFINTPAKNMLEVKEDFTKEGNPLSMSSIYSYFTCPEDLEGSDLKISLTVWQDEAKTINQAEIERTYLESGCSRVKLILIRKPRETVRAEKVLNADTLCEKLCAMAELRGEKLSNGVILKATDIEQGEQEPWKRVDHLIN